MMDAQSAWFSPPLLLVLDSDWFAAADWFYKTAGLGWLARQLRNVVVSEEIQDQVR
jgi:hypothetical protein